MEFREQYIKESTAKLARQKGLPQRLTSYAKYYIDGKLKNKPTEHLGSIFERYEDIAFAPSQSTLQKWLREIHKINIVVDVIYDINQYCYKAHKTINQDFEQIVQRFGKKAEEFSYPTYEEALELALIEALKQIK